MADLQVPEYTELSDVYAEDGESTLLRYQKINLSFQEQFGAAPEVYARAPGRVNLIGEHIDYEGYAVLPMAIKQDTVVAIRRHGDKMVLSSLTPDQYPTITFDIDPTQAVNTSNHTWGNYFVSAYKGFYELLAAKGVEAPLPVGLQVLVHGIVPQGSGLSSSAAIVCSSLLALAAVHGVALTKGEVAERACLAERYVGVTSGGMDQAISVMGMTGVAKLVEFNPVRATDVLLPSDATFVISNSLAVSNKAETADKHYNLRVVECRLAAALLAAALGAPIEKVESIQTLLEVEPLIQAMFGPGEDAQAAAVQMHLHPGEYFHGEIDAQLGFPLAQLFKDNATSARVASKAAEDGFLLQDRALHVYSEAARVRAFQATANDTSCSAEQRLEKLGKLMDSSHASCAGLYDCSCPELEKLVKLAKQSGALGARLTGAGWGGCSVSLVRSAEVAGFLKALQDGYYAPLVARGVVRETDLGDVVFASKPASGAAVLRLGSLGTPDVGRTVAHPAELVAAAPL